MHIHIFFVVVGSTILPEDIKCVFNEKVSCVYSLPPPEDSQLTLTSLFFSKKADREKRKKKE